MPGGDFVLNLIWDLFLVSELAYSSPAFYLEIDEYYYFLNSIEIVAAVLSVLLHFDYLLSELAPFGWQLETLICGYSVVF